MTPEPVASSSIPVAGVPERLRYLEHLFTLMSSAKGDTLTALLGGVVFWLVGIDDLLNDANPMVKGLPYRTRRSQEPGGQTLRGIRIARHEIAHGTALLVEEGISFPMRFPMNFSATFVLPDRIVKSYADRGRTPPSHDLDLYDQLVANKTPNQVVQQVVDWLRTL